MWLWFVLIKRKCMGKKGNVYAIQYLLYMYSRLLVVLLCFFLGKCSVSVKKCYFRRLFLSILLSKWRLDLDWLQMYISICSIYMLCTKLYVLNTSIAIAQHSLCLSSTFFATNEFAKLFTLSVHKSWNLLLFHENRIVSRIGNDFPRLLEHLRK